VAIVGNYFETKKSSDNHNYKSHFLGVKNAKEDLCSWDV
jgi:hypothetical protein